MRLWSLNPKYLDTKGLLALWREGLLAKKVLEGKTRGYRNHPQLERFKKCADPLSAINAYLCHVLAEAVSRGYSFDESKVCMPHEEHQIAVTRGQVAHEVEHLKSKLKRRDIKRFREMKLTKRFLVNPVFEVVPGKIASWEKV
jgi:hypothetical protein